MVCWWQSLSEGNVQKVKLFLRYNIDMYLIQDYRQTAVHTVCRGGCTTGHVHTLTLLIECGADINAMDEFENTPLHLVAYRGYAAMCRVLLRAGANTLRYNLKNERPVDVARRLKRRDAYEMLATWRAAKHWREWTQRCKRRRERHYLLKVWYYKGISCDFRHLVCWI